LQNVKHLMEQQEANPTLEDHNGIFPLSAAIHGLCLPVAQYLMEQGNGQIDSKYFQLCVDRTIQYYGTLTPSYKQVHQTSIDDFGSYLIRHNDPIVSQWLQQTAATPENMLLWAKELRQRKDKDSTWCYIITYSGSNDYPDYCEYWRYTPFKWEMSGRTEELEAHTRALHEQLNSVLRMKMQMEAFVEHQLQATNGNAPRFK